MKMKLVIGLVLVMGLAIGTADAQIAGGIKDRARIHQGMRSGELTRFEKHRLHKEQRKINRHRRHFRKNDGKISPRERRMLQYEKKKHSRHIYRYKHNRFDRS